MSSPFEAAGFRAEVHTRPTQKEFGQNLSPAIVVIAIIAAMVVVLVVSRSGETYSNVYSMSKISEKADYAISEGAYIYMAPVTAEGAYIGALPEGVEIYGAQLYTATYVESFDETGSYYGIKKEYLGGCDAVDLSKDTDGVIWIRKGSVQKIIPPEGPKPVQ